MPLPEAPSSPAGWVQVQTRDETPQRLSSLSQGCRPRQREGEGSKPPTKPSNAAMRQTLCSDDSTAGAQLGPPSGRPEAPETMTIASAPPGRQGQRGPRTSPSEGDPGRVSQNRGVIAPSPPASTGPRAAAPSSPDVAAAGCGSHLSGGRPPPPKSLPRPGAHGALNLRPGCHVDSTRLRCVPLSGVKFSRCFCYVGLPTCAHAHAHAHTHPYLNK